MIITGRFPVPRLVVCDQHGSQVLCFHLLLLFLFLSALYVCTIICQVNALFGALMQARFLLAKLNPSATYTTSHEVAPGSDIIFTDDVSFQVFSEHLQRLAVQS